MAQKSKTKIIETKFKDKSYRVIYQEYIGQGTKRLCLHNENQEVSKNRLIPRKTFFIEKFRSKELYLEKCKLKDDLYRKFKDFPAKNMLEVLNLSSFQKDDKEFKIMYERYWYSFDMSTDNDAGQPKILNVIMAIDQLISVLKLFWNKEMYIPNLSNGQISFNHQDDLTFDPTRFDISFDIDDYVDVSTFEGKFEDFSFFRHSKYTNLVYMINHFGPISLQIKKIQIYSICLAEILWEGFFPKFGSLPTYLLWNNQDDGVTEYFDSVYKLIKTKTDLDDENKVLILKLISDLIKKPRNSFDEIQNCFRQPILTLINNSEINLEVQQIPSFGSVTETLIQQGKLIKKNENTLKKKMDNMKLNEPSDVESDNESEEEVDSSEDSVDNEED